MIGTHMSKPEVLLRIPIYPPVQADLEREFIVHKLWTAGDAGKFLRDVGAGVRAVVTTGIQGCKAEMIGALRHSRSSRASARRMHDRSPGCGRTRNRGDQYADGITATVRGACRRNGRLADAQVSEERPIRARRTLAAEPRPGRAIRSSERRAASWASAGSGGRRQRGSQRSGCRSNTRAPAVRRTELSLPADVESLAREADLLVVTAIEPETRNLIDARVIDALGHTGFL